MDPTTADAFHTMILSEGYTVLPIADNEHKYSVTAPSPTRNTTALKPRSPSPAFSPPLQQSDAGFDSQKGYTVADNERSFQKSEVDACVDRRSLPSSSGTTGLPPPHPLTRTSYVPLLLSPPILPPRSSPGMSKSEVAARTDQSPSKRLKRLTHQIRELLDEVAVDYDLDEVVEATPESEGTLVDDKVLSCGGGPDEVAGPEEVAGQELKKDVEEEAGDYEVVELEGVEVVIRCKCGPGHIVLIVGKCHSCYLKEIN